MAATNNLDAQCEEFDVRLKNELPDTSFDIYISSGGPGDPLHSRFEDWDIAWCKWVDEMVRWNDNPEPAKEIRFLYLSFFPAGQLVILMQDLFAKENPLPLAFSRFICWKPEKMNRYLMDFEILFMPLTAAITR